MHYMRMKMIRLISWRKEQSGEKRKREIKMSQMDCLMKKIPLSRIFGEEICQNSERVPAILCTH
jgi:hypothetical protein